MVTPLVAAIQQVLDAVVGNPPEGASVAPVVVRSYREDVASLWEQTLSDEPATFDKTMIVVWDGYPSKRKLKLIPSEMYLTPLDWAVACSLAAARSVSDDAPSTGFPRLRVAIFDLVSAEHPGGDAVRFFAQFPGRHPASLSWVRVARPGRPPTPEWAFEDLLGSLLAGVSGEGTALQPAQAFPSFRDAGSAARADTVTVRRWWAGALTRPARPGDHHAMSNIVGPVMLLGRTSPALGWDRFGIYALMNAVGLINETRHTKHVAEDPAPDSRSALPWLRMGDVGEDPGGSLGAWERGLEAIHPLLGRESVDVIVVDDHAWGDGGWAEVVCRAVGAQWIEPDPAVYAADAEPVLVGQRAESGATVYGTSRPDVLLGMIDGRDRRFACDVLGGKGSLSGAQILLLDLRLFSGRDDAREVAFFKSLLKMARLFEVESPTSRARATDGATLPWPGFATSELADIQAWLDSPGPKRETAHYFKALTLLPRLLALTDLSLPIVLFSSTGRREITDMLVPYGNIITAFEKPRFLGATDVDMAVETSDKFRTAMGRAMELLAARLVCVRLHRLRRTEQVERVPAENAPGAATVGWTVELLVDETGEERRGHLTVGGLLVVIPPGHDCSGAEAIIRAEAAKSPGRALKDRIRQQRSEIAVALERWSATAGVALGVVAVRGEIARSLFSSEGQADPLFDERVADNLHRYLLQVILELAVFHKARQVIPRPAWDRTVFNYRIGTRIWKPVSREFGRAMWEKWGVETRAVGTVGELARALSHLERYLRARDRDATADDILNQLLEVLRQYLPTADVAMAVPLIDPGDARPIVESVKRRYLRSRFDPQSDVARAYHLNSESSGASLLHLYADGVLGHRWDKLPAGLREIGFQTDLDDALEDILASLRLYLHGRWAEAIAGAAWTLSGSVSMPAGSIIPSLLPDLAAAAAELSGEDNLTLARSLVSDPDSLRPPVVPPSTTFQGNVESKGPNSLWIQDAVTRRRYISFPFGSRGWSSLRPGDRVEFHVVRSEAPGRFQAVDVCKSTCPAGCGADTF